VRDRAGSLAGLFTQVVDLSEQKEREESLRRELAEATWLGHIHEALAEDRLVLHAQPICDLATGAVVQQELLIRMVDREGHLIAPVRFLPIAEKLGLIMEIDRWVISQAAVLASQGMAVEVNVSADSMGRPALLDHVESELLRTGADPALLVFEITETALMRDMAGGEAFARRLSAIGCGFALDDFGTGFGGFTYLQRLPVDFIKIDREFVRDLPRSERDQHLVRTIVSLAQGLGQKTIAEGVEDQATLELLAELGVDYGQGYHLGRPGPLARPAAALPGPLTRRMLSHDPGRSGGRPRQVAPLRAPGRRAAH
jgi:EAL domain-containing protein (putative c-di-GMP-specific phosphodiesterase class I)